jgi:lipoprotein-anchoring transpeptidase ErfK/SrfK
VTPVPTPEPTIAAGVTSGGVDLSGMTIAQAEAALRTALTKPAKAPVIVAVAGKRFTLKTKKVKLKFDANRTARRAFNAGRATPPAPGAKIDVPPAIEFIRTPIRTFVAKAAAKVYFAPRDATVRITITRVSRTHSHEGRRLAQKKVHAAIEKALADPRLPRLLKPGRKTLKPKVTAKDLPARYPAILTIDRSSFTLRYFHRLKLSMRYSVAVGQPAYPTPTGLYSIQNKQVNPTWTVPNSPWAGELQGQSVSGSDPSNPLKARWMGIVNGVGIHGTGQDYSIGTAASHGCIRMHVSDVIDLYPRVPVGTPVLIQ